jgi:hypothetical protein
VEREGAESFLYEYTHVTGLEMTLVGIGERPDFACEIEGQRYGLELVKVMLNPMLRGVGGDYHLNGQDAVSMIQDTVYAKEQKRTSVGWRFHESTILVLQLEDSDGEEVMEYLDEGLMDEISETGFCEIWITDTSTMEPFGNVQLIGIKPERWRGLHLHSSYGKKPYG